jgi:hypothetical protein
MVEIEIEIDGGDRDRYRYRDIDIDRDRYREIFALILALVINLGNIITCFFYGVLFSQIFLLVFLNEKALRTC